MGRRACTPTYWKSRMEWTMRLFNEGSFDHCIADCRTMLLYKNLPPFYRIYCHTFLAAYLSDWYEAEEERVAAEKSWIFHYNMYRHIPANKSLRDACMHEIRDIKSLRDACMQEIRDILDDLAEDMEHDRPVEGEKLSTGNARRRRSKVSRKTIMASTSQAPTNHAVSAVKATAETAFPTRHTTTLTVRSRGPIEEDGTAVRKDSVFDKTTSQNRLSASADHDHNQGRADDATIPVIYIHDQDSALHVPTDNDVAMSDE